MYSQKKNLGIILAFGAMLGACGGGARSNEEPETTATSGSESPYAGPIASTNVAHGAERYEVACGSCHNNGAPPLANLGWTAEHMRRQIREGGSQMPPIGESRLSSSDMEDVLAHLVTMGAVTQ